MLVSEHMNLVQKSIANDLASWLPPVVERLIWTLFPTTCYQRRCPSCQATFPAKSCGGCHPCGQRPAKLKRLDIDALICVGCGEVGCKFCLRRAYAPCATGYRCHRCRTSCMDADCDHYVCRNDCNHEKRSCDTCSDYPFCSDCVQDCSECGDSHCNSCRVRTCTFCFKVTCAGRVSECELCSHLACWECTYDCAQCRNGAVCNKCSRECETCGDRVCLTCAVDFGQTAMCFECRRRRRCHVCSNHQANPNAECGSCELRVCDICSSQCGMCQGILCSDCEPAMCECSACHILYCTSCQGQGSEGIQDEGQCFDCFVRPKKRVKSI
jgi:hypothetical protein